MSAGEAIRRRLAEIAVRELELERQEVEALRAEAAKRAEERRARLEAEAVQSFAAFVRLFWGVVEPAPLEWGWHMQAVCDALQSVAEGKCRRLIINIPPGFSKSLLTSVFFPAWKWLRWPSDRTLYLSHSADLARRDSRRTRILVTSPEYTTLLKKQPKAWTIARDQNELLNFENSARGFRHCAPLGAGITGKRGDNIVIDDPHDAKAAIEGSPERIAERMAEDATNFDQVIQSRLNDQRTGSIVLIMQRLHENDLTGHLKKTGEWATLILPMRFDPNEADPKDARTASGELLDARRFPEDVVARIETALGPQASGQLQQRPVSPTGGLFPVQEWTWMDRRAFPAAFDREAAGWDLAFGANESGAYHVGHFGGLKAGKVYLLEEVRGRFTSPDLYDNMRAAKKRRPKSIGWYIEDRAAARPAIENLEKEIPGLIRVQPEGDKYARAQSWQPYVKAGNIVLPCTCGVMVPHHHENVNTLPGEDWANDLVKEHASFPKGAVKDRVDALGYLVKALLEQAGAARPLPSRAHYRRAPDMVSRID